MKQLSAYQALAASGELKTLDAQEIATKIIRESKLSEDLYYWVIDDTGKILTHPAMPQLEGTSIDQVPGLVGQRLAERFVAATKQGGGWVHYKWYKPSSDRVPVDKLSYVVRPEKLSTY